MHLGTLTQMHYAVELDRLRSFQKAAKACFVTQPTLSMQIQKLEDSLGLVLFDRSRKPVAPTEAAQEVLDQFRVVLRESQRVQDIIQAQQGEVAGVYRLAIIPTMAPTILPRILRPFLEAYPKVELHIEELQTPKIIERLHDETLDGGILATPLGLQSLHESPFFREHLMVFHAADLEVPMDRKGRARLEELPSDQLLVMQEGHCLRTQTLDLCAMGKAAVEAQRFRLDAGSVATLIQLVGQGPYYTVIPALTAQDLEAQGLSNQIKEVAGQVPYREVAMVSRRIEHRRAIREALIKTADEALKVFGKSRRPLRAAPIPPH